MDRVISVDYNFLDLDYTITIHGSLYFTHGGWCVQITPADNIFLIYEPLEYSYPFSYFGIYHNELYHLCYLIDGIIIEETSDYRITQYSFEFHAFCPALRWLENIQKQQKNDFPFLL